MLQAWFKSFCQISCGELLLSLYIVFSGQQLSAVSYVSLGAFCATAMNLRYEHDPLRSFHLRPEAYPFDWLKSSFTALYGCLADDFAHFLTDLRLYEGHTVSDFYGFEFIHDWPTQTQPHFDVVNSDDGVNGWWLVANWQDFNEQVREKYARRITRFRKLCLSSNEKVFFIRYHDVTKAQAILLRDLISAKYPNLDFELIVIISTEPVGTVGEKWQLAKIRNFYVPIAQWGDLPIWGEIFAQLAASF